MTLSAAFKAFFTAAKMCQYQATEINFTYSNFDLSCYIATLQVRYTKYTAMLLSYHREVLARG